MPGLQSLVSAWVKVNHGHGEYFGDVSSARDRAVAASSSSSSVPPPQPSSPSPSVGLATSSLSGPLALPPAVSRPVSVAAGQQPPRLPTSSLSTYAMVPSGVGTSSVPPPAPSSTETSRQMWPLNHETFPQTTSTMISSSIDPTTASNTQRYAQHAPTTAPAIHHRSRKTAHGHYHPYHDTPTHDRAPPHPQAGADAILGRRKTNAHPPSSSSSISNYTRPAAAATHLAMTNRYRRRSSEGLVGMDDPISDYIQSYSDYGLFPSLVEGDPAARVGQGYHAPLNHDNNSSSIHDNNNNKDTESSLSLQHQRNKNKFDALLQQHHDDRNSFGTNDSLRRDWNNMSTLTTTHPESNATHHTTSAFHRENNNTNNEEELDHTPITGRYAHRHSIPMSQITDTSSDNLEQPPATKAKSAAIPIPPSKPIFGRQKIKKSHSRSDLVRQMALDRNVRSARDPAASSGYNDAESVASNGTSPRRNSFLANAKDEGVAVAENPVPSTGNVVENGRVGEGRDSWRGGEDGARMAPLSGTNPSSVRNSEWFPYRSPTMPSMATDPSSRKMSFDSQSTVETGNVGPRRLHRETLDPFDVEHDLSLMNQRGGPRNAAMGTASASAAMTHPVGSTADCDRCAQMEATLLSLQADVEYLRSLELQREFVCMECESSGSVLKHHSKSKKSSSRHPYSHHTPSIPENPSSVRSESSAISTGSRGSSRIASSKQIKRASAGSIGGTSRSTLRTSLQGGGSRTATVLREASKRLGDLSTRHKRQVKQSTHERAYWQNDMHLKLEKFAMMAKNLNEEAAKRSDEVKETQAALEKVTSERNGLISQVETLKARVALYEEESVDHAKMRKKWERDELQSLTEMERLRNDQDVIIHDLSLRLDLAMKTIETERRQQQQRRQIIFPSSRQSSSLSRDGTNSPSSPHQRRSSLATPEPAKSEDLDGIQRTAKETTRKYRLVIETAMDQSAAREKEMRARVEALEQELREAKLKNSSRGLAGDDSLDVMDLIEGRLRYRASASSTASL